jgi:hypothetical protein
MSFIGQIVGSFWPTLNWLIDWFKAIDWRPEAITAAGTIVLAALTSVLAVGTIFLWLATVCLVRVARDTARRQLRAYVHVDNLRINNIRDDCNKRIEVIFKNFGMTPARSLVNKCICDPYIPNTSLSLRNANVFELADLGPTQTVYSTPIYPQGKWDTELFDIADGTKIFYVFGVLTYIDVFKERHVTEYRYHLRFGDVGTKTKKGDQTSLVMDSREGNRTT